MLAESLQLNSWSAYFVTMGILFSFINTPIGFANGLVTHLWLLVAFVAARQCAHIKASRAPALAATTSAPFQIEAPRLNVDGTLHPKRSPRMS